jgi:hypothetical protein
MLQHLSTCQFHLFLFNILVLFVAVPEPLYSGPDSVQLFSTASLEVDIMHTHEIS